MGQKLLIETRQLVSKLKQRRRLAKRPVKYEHIRERNRGRVAEINLLLGYLETKERVKTMTTAVTKTNNTKSIVPKATMQDVQKLETTVAQCHEAILQSSAFSKAIVESQAIDAILKCLTPAIMADVMKLMDSPLGFKTDRASGNKPSYTEAQVRNVLLTALVRGARIGGNEFNIIAGQCYFTKEFFRRAILEFPGLTHLSEPKISPPTKHGESTVAMEAFISWRLHGEEQSVSCRKDDESGVDSRIIVKTYHTDGPAKILGVAESRLLRKVMQKLTGLNYQIIGDDESNTVDAKPTKQEAPTLTHQPDLDAIEVGRLECEADLEAVANTKSLNAWKTRVNKWINSQDCDDAAKSKFRAWAESAAETKKQTIKALDQGAY